MLWRIEFLIKHTPGGAACPPISGLTVTVLGTCAEEDPGYVEQISPITWRYHRVLELHSEMDELTFVAQSEDCGDLGYLFFTSDELSALMVVESDVKLERDFIMEGDSVGHLKVHFCIGIQRNTNEDLTPVFSLRELGLSLVTPENSAEHPSVTLKAMGDHLIGQFKNTLKIDDVTKALSAYQHAMKLASPNDSNYGIYLCGAVGALLERFKFSGNVADIDRAISMMKEEVARSREGTSSLNQAAGLNNCVTLFRTRFEHYGKPQDLKFALKYQQQMVEITAQSDTSLPKRLQVLGYLFRTWHAYSSDPTDLENAIVNHKMAVQLTSEDDPELPSRLMGLGTSFRIRFERYGHDLADLEGAIRNQERAVRLFPEGHINRPGVLDDLGLSLFARFQHTRNREDLDASIKMHQQAIQIIPQYHSDRASFFSNLATSLQTRCEYYGDLEDITTAINYHQQVLKVTQDSRSDIIALLLNNLGEAFWTQYSMTGAVAHLDSAIPNYERALELLDILGSRFAMHRVTNISSWEGVRVRTLLNLARTLTTRFENGKGNLEDINRAISYEQTAIQLLPEGHDSLAGCLSGLGISLAARFKTLGNLEDIEVAISNQQRAVGMTREGHVDLPTRLAHLASSYLARFQKLGNRQDIESAIENQQRAVQLTHEVHPQQHVRLADLGNLFSSRFTDLGDTVDLENAILILQQSVQCAPPWFTHLPLRLMNLAAALASRFSYNQEIGDLERAISNLEQAVKLFPEHQAELPMCLSNLGITLIVRFEKTGNPDDVDCAISHMQKALALIPDSQTFKLAQALAGLGGSFSARFTNTQDLADIDLAISYFQQAVNAVPVGHTDHPVFLSGLARSCANRFGKTKDLADIERAIASHQKVVQCTPKEHHGLAIRTYDLATSLLTRFEVTGDPQSLAQAIAMFKKATKETSGHPRTRLSAGYAWGKLCTQYHTSEFSEAWNVTIGLLSQAAGLEQTISKRHNNLVYISTITTFATGAAFDNSAFESALAWLEQGRCLVWNQISQLRTPVDRLRVSKPSLAGRFLQLANGLEASGFRQQSSIPAAEVAITPRTIAIQDEIHAHARFAKDWDNLLSEIRRIPGFRDFLQPPKVTDILERLPQDTPIVIFSIAQERCDALALVSGVDTPIHIALADFTYEKAIELRRELQGYLRAHGVRLRDDEPDPDADRGGHQVQYQRRQGGLHRILRSLWLDVVQPILSGIGYSSPPSHRMRIWWCPTGPLAFLPLHAAGIYGEDRTPGSLVSDFVVSSYTPTVTALLEKLKEEPAKKQGHDTILLVSQPETPGRTKLPGAKKETEALIALMSGKGIEPQLLEGEEATTVRVKTEMAAHSCIHLACHAVQDIAKPLNSGFCLHDGLLQLLEIMPQRLANTEHAFLSACQTSTGDENLSDEAVHLAAGMLAAGYRGVVATMWSIRDKYGPEIASTFYSRLLEEGESCAEEGVVTKIDGAGAARALDFSVQKIREKLGDGESDLLAWLPYVHFGV
ncbi:unnamed protein product [Cyclocybe aegerita]|uniref:CHAT domain-containing protein n=1 Tax=Cyclocybe aegerita TaxID=1973307 RepID=A0A8S0VU55_CYCAE|nr:unnamed protein product [Cyclocybe aegerita]